MRLSGREDGLLAEDEDEDEGHGGGGGVGAGSSSCQPESLYAHIVVLELVRELQVWMKEGRFSIR